MVIEVGIGLSTGVLLIWVGYIVRTQQVFAFPAGFRESWEPVNRERLGIRDGIIISL